VTTPQSLPHNIIEITAKFAGTAVPCIGRAVAERNAPYRGTPFPGAAHRAVVSLLALHRDHAPFDLDALTRRALRPRDYQDLEAYNADRTRISALLPSTLEWLDASRPEILAVRPELGDPTATYRTDGTGLRMRLLAKPHVVLRVGGQLMVLDAVIGRALECAEDLARSPRFYVYDRLARCHYPDAPIRVGQWSPATGAMAVATFTLADQSYARQIIIDLANALGGVAPAPLTPNPFCRFCAIRAACDAWSANCSDLAQAEL